MVTVVRVGGEIIGWADYIQDRRTFINGEKYRC